MGAAAAASVVPGCLEQRPDWAGGGAGRAAGRLVVWLSAVRSGLRARALELGAELGELLVVGGAGIRETLLGMRRGRGGGIAQRLELRSRSSEVGARRGGAFLLVAGLVAGCGELIGERGDGQLVAGGALFG